MHAERLHSIASAIVEDAQTIRLIQTFDSLIGAVTNRISQPADPQFDEAVSSEFKSLLGVLKDSKTSEFSLTWQKMIIELGLDELLADNIRAEIEEAFEDRLVDTDAQNALTALKDRIQGKLTALQQVRDGFQQIGLNNEELPAGEIELNIAMPRESIDDHLDGFKKELSELDKQLRVISSILKDDSPNFRINSISTTDFSLSLNINLDLGDVLLASAIALHMARAKFATKSKAIEEELGDLPDSILEQIRSWAENTINQKIEEILNRLPEDCEESVDPVKLNSNRGPIAAALKYLAVKLQDGFNFDVRNGPLDEVSQIDEEALGDQQTELLRNRRERLSSLSRRSAELKVIERQNVTLLSLTDSSAEEPEASTQSLVDLGDSSGEEPAQ